MKYEIKKVDEAKGIIQITTVDERWYVKEDGKWKISKLHFFLNFRTPYEDGWLKTPVIGQNGPDQQVPPDEPPTTWHPYPSPFRLMPHFKHPVTGE